MEIVTIPFTGALQHKDSTGGEGIIKAGDVQIMTAGTGVRHSEANASATESVTLFQIWVFPKERNIAPRYDQRTFNMEERQNKWQTVVSPIADDDALWINQNARFSLTELSANTPLTYTNAFAGNGMYIIIVEGNISVENIDLDAKDAVGIWEKDSVIISAKSNALVLLLEVPMEF